MSGIVLADTFTVGADTNIGSYPSAGAPSFSYMTAGAGAGDVVVNAANDRVQSTVTTLRRVRCIHALMPKDKDQEATLTGLQDMAGNRSQSALLLRCASGSDDCYAFRINLADQNVEILRVDAAVGTTLVTVSRSLSDGTHTIRGRAETISGGATVRLTCWVDDKELVTVDDSNAARKLTGTPGFQIFNDVANEAWLDDFIVNDLVYGTRRHGLWPVLVPA